MPQLCQATPADLAAIIAMLADDELGAAREIAAADGPLDPAYLAAFAAITASGENELWVARDGDAVVGCFQLTFTPSLSYQGGMRATIESVRTRRDRRGQGIGQMMMRHAIQRARARACVLIQLTSNAQRLDAHRFYERLGFSKSHIGMKIDLRHP